MKHGLEDSLFGDPVVDDIAGWCRRLIDGLKDGGVWGIPRTGVVFRKTGHDRLTWVGNMPAREEGGENHREDEFRSNREQFSAAGVLVDREEKMMGFEDLDAARTFYGAMDSFGDGWRRDSRSQSRTDPKLDYRSLNDRGLYPTAQRPGKRSPMSGLGGFDAPKGFGGYDTRHIARQPTSARSVPPPPITAWPRCCCAPQASRWT